MTAPFLTENTLSSPANFCYLPVPLSRRSVGDLNYLIEATGGSLPLYFALKGKHGYHFEERMSFMADIAKELRDFASQFDIVVIPESRFPVLTELTAGLPNVLQLSKRHPAEICGSAHATAGWNKLELESQYRAWAEMGDSFTINTIKSNQRQHYVPFLFKPVQLPAGARVLLVDDFVMTGNTVNAMRAAIGRAPSPVFGVFYQPGYTGFRQL